MPPFHQALRSSRLSPGPVPHERIKAASSNLSVYRRYGSRDGFAPRRTPIPVTAREYGGERVKGGIKRDDVAGEGKEERMKREG